jgi:peptidoglycan/LPS O-acetylase OafA/YrhL
MSKMLLAKYRPEVDGLRAIAVASVLFFHAGFTEVPGGFMGVDIFFVISGYLITSLIKKDIAGGKFALSTFWERRFRRILPPLFVVISATLVASLFIFLPIELAEFGKQLMAQSLFSSNLLFAKQGGYFDAANELKPMLHTWSLAVEEQFYLFFPLAMYAIGKFFNKKYAPFFTVGSIISLALSLIYIGISQRYAFYLLPFRGWELLAGSLIAVAPRLRSKTIKEVISCISALVILGCFIFYKDTYAFPGYVALLPVIGTMGVIWANDGELTLIGKVLKSRGMVGLGLISYSLYLWHWPIFVLVGYALIPYSKFTPEIGLICIAISTILATATFYLIERPVRQRKVLTSSKSIYVSSFAGLALFGALGGALVYMQGLPGRFSEPVLSYALAGGDINPKRWECDAPSVSRISISDVCNTNKSAGKATFAVWGDSQGDAMMPAFYELSNRFSKNGLVLTSRGCKPILDMENDSAVFKYHCVEQNDAFLKLIEREKIPTVFLIGAWRGLGLEGRDRIVGNWYHPDSTKYSSWKMAALGRTVDELLRLGVDVHIIIDPPQASEDPSRILAMQERYSIQEKFTIPLGPYNEALEKGILQFRKEYANPKVTFIDPRPLLCGLDSCKTESKGKGLYYDRTHLGTTGAKLLTEIFVPAMAEKRQDKILTSSLNN